MKQILVASDFSKCAANAMAYAVELAKVLQLKICVIHAIQHTEGVNNSTYNAIFIEKYYENKRQALKEWAAGFIAQDKDAPVHMTTLCHVGFLKNVVSHYINQHPVELLIMGTAGSTGITAVGGSNVSMMVRKIKIPTLIIPLEIKFKKTPIITLATDFETRLSAEDVNALNKMVKAFGPAKMQVLYVAGKPEGKAILIGESKLKDLIKHTKLEFNYISNNSAINGIINFIASNETDILCLVKHQHNIIYRLFTRSTVNQAVNKTVTAILVLHE